MCDQQSLRPACGDAQSDQSRCSSLKCSMTVQLLTEHHLAFLSLKGGCTGSSQSTLVKMPHCWKSHVMAQLFGKYHQLVDLYKTSSNYGPVAKKPLPWGSRAIGLHSENIKTFLFETSRPRALLFGV